MPGRDGYTFLADFAARGGPSAGVPVIVVSAYAPDEGTEDGAGSQQPFFDALLKPVHYEELRSALQRALASPHTV